MGVIVSTGDAAAPEVPEGYKTSDLGPIPDDWDVVPMSELLDFRNGANADKSAYGHGIRFINVLEVITKSRLSAEDVPGRVALSRAAIEAYAVRRGDVLFNRTSETQEEVGLAAVYHGDEPLVFGGFVIRGRPMTSRLDAEYSGYGLRSAAVRQQIVKRGQGAIRANIGQAELRQVLVPLPPAAEQRAIARALIDTDELIQMLERLVVKKRDTRQAMLNELLIWQAEEWPTLPFARIFRRVDSKSHQIQTSEYEEYGAYPVIDQGQIPVVGYSDRVEKVLPCPPGGLIVFGDHTRVVKYVDRDFVVGADGTQILSLDGANVPRFFYYQLLTKEIPNTGYNRHFKFLKEMSFAVPLVAEQESIARKLADADNEMEALRREVEKVRAIKVGMMQALLSGRVRLLRDAEAQSHE
jgi:type I restriction enzyme S subunit